MKDYISDTALGLGGTNELVAGVGAAWVWVQTGGGLWCGVLRPPHR